MRDAAAFIASQTNSAPAGLLATLINTARTVWVAGLRRRKLASLLDLDDHMLADVGVTRADVKWALDLPFSHDPGLELQRRALRNRARGWRA
jgi:uncharacterized protein YjiS (DUF1127 family)